MQIRWTSERDKGIKTVRDFQVENRFTITWEGSFFCIAQLENPGQFRPLHLFSDGNVYDRRRSRLLPTTGEKILFLHHNLRQQHENWGYIWWITQYRMNRMLVNGVRVCECDWYISIKEIKLLQKKVFHFFKSV